MEIRPAKYEELEGIYAIYERARAFMRENGNPDQWGEVYPSAELIKNDLDGGHLRVLVGESGELEGVFSVFPEGDADYNVIDGKWLNDKPYAAVHRIASAGLSRGIFGIILDYCLGISDNLKIDTHRQNTVMQRVLKKHGFIECGIIKADGLPFVAFQYCKDK